MNLKAPRAIIEVDGASVKWSDIIDIKVENTLYLAADSFECRLNNESLLSDWFRKEQEVKIFMGYVKDPYNWSKSELTHMFTGRIDGVKPSFDNPATVNIIGRDYSSGMIDTEYSVAYKDITSSSVAHMFATKYHLKPVITDTTTILPKDLYTDKKEWEVLQAAADLDGFVCYVTKDAELYYGERNDQDETVCAELYYNQGSDSNCRIEFDDSSVDVLNKITVRHWVSKETQLVEASSQDDTLIKSMGRIKERVFYISKIKTVEQAKQYADKLLKKYSRSAVTGNGSCAGNPAMYAEGKVQVTGCGRFSGIYYIDRVTHSLSKSSGYTNSFDITNLRAESAYQYRQDMYNYNEKRY